MAALEGNTELQQTILFSMRDDSSNAFNLITNRAFESGQLWRRLVAADILSESHGHIYNHIIERLGVGWSGHDGVSPREIRNELYEALRGDDPERRTLVAKLFGRMDERGLLMAARDQGGPGSEEARERLRRMNNPEAD